MSKEVKGYLTSSASSRIVLHASSRLLSFACSLLTLLKHSKYLHSLHWVSYCNFPTHCHRISRMQKALPKKRKILPNLEQVSDSFDHLSDYIIFAIIFIAYSLNKKGIAPHTTYFIPWSNTPTSTRSPPLYLDEKPINTDLMKFLSLYPSILARYLEFALAFSISLTPFHNHALSLYKSKWSITP